MISVPATVYLHRRTTVYNYRQISKQTKTPFRLDALKLAHGVMALLMKHLCDFSSIQISHVSNLLLDACVCLRRLPHIQLFIK